MRILVILSVLIRKSLEQQAFFFNWINRHYPCNLRDARLRKSFRSLYSYDFCLAQFVVTSVCVILSVLCYALGKIDYVAALHVAYRHLLKK